MGFGWLLGRILDDFWCKLGAKMGAKTRKNEVPEPFGKMSEKCEKKKEVVQAIRAGGGSL